MAIARIGSHCRALGALLFAGKSMRRRQMEMTYITPGQMLYDTATRDLRKSSEPLWGRRPVFYRGAKSLLVSEVFFAHSRCSFW